MDSVLSISTEMAKKAPERVTNVNLGHITAEQDDALKAVAEKLTRERGNLVKRADLTREALAMFCRHHGVRWPC